MIGASIRNIRRNKSEMAVGVRCNRYGGERHFSFKNYRKADRGVLCETER